jgi:hypothetical protein
MRAIVVVALAIASCNPPLSDRQYCVKRQMAWESAFPAVAQTDAQREQFIQSCLAKVPAQHASGEFERSVACFDTTITGRGHATDEYLAFERCVAR